MTTTALALIAALGLAQGLQPEQPQPKPTERKPAEPEPTLDELLGLPKPSPKAREPATTPRPSNPEEPGTQPADPSRAELERQLSAAEMDALFDQAVALMDQTAVRLAAAKDPGIDTQRMQEDVVRKLDALIDQARKQQRQQKSKSKKQQQQQQQQQQQDQQQSSQQSNAKAGDSQNQSAGPGRVDGTLNPAPGGTAAWGTLPPHLRDALSQGKDDRYSSRYRALTEKYYRRLAEEPKPGDLPPTPDAPRP